MTMSEEQQADPWVARYVGAMEHMHRRDFDAACVLLLEIIDEWNKPGHPVNSDLAAHAHCTYGCCLRDKGEIKDAIFWFDLTGRNFAYMGGDAPRAAAIADLLRAQLLEKTGDVRTAHALLEQMTVRTLMESHPDIRTIWQEAMEDKTRLEKQYGIDSGDGLTDILPITPPPCLDKLTVTYEGLKNIFDNVPRVWRVEDGQLVVSEGGKDRVIPFADVTGLALKFDPTRVARNRHTVRLRTRNTKSVETSNMSYRGIADFEDKSEDYRRMILVLTERLAKSGARFPVTTGSSWLGWTASIVLAAFIALIVLITFAIGGPVVMLVKAGLLLLYTPKLWRWIKRNKPRSFALDAVPLTALPGV
jgi:hypothetical protein